MSQGYNKAMNTITDTLLPITQPATLRELARTLLSQTILGVDTESNSLYAFHERVCLIQFSTTQADYLIDPLALKDLSPLAEVFASPRIKKIFHAAEYDLICLKRDFGFRFANLFDTMAAARMLGRKEVGLGALLQLEFDVQVDKRHQRANWGMRPLPENLLAYASQDTHYLIPLYERLHSELEAKDLLGLAQEEFERLRRTSVPNTVEDAHAWWRISGSHDLSPQQAAVLQELSAYRLGYAEQIDRPLFKIIGDKTLLAIASNCPANQQELQTLPGMSPKQIKRHGKALLQAVQRGLRAEPLFAPHPPRPDERRLARMEALREWRKGKAKEAGVESDVILSRDQLVSLASRNPLTQQALEDVLHEFPHRLQNYGAELLQVLIEVEENGRPGAAKKKRARRNLKGL